MKQLSFITALCILISQPAAANLLTAFDGSEGDIRWRVVNDNVMGGRSDGGFKIDTGSLLFTGATNTRGGGFSSIRSVPQAIALPQAAQGFELKLKGDGRTYTFRVVTSANVTYWAEFPTTEEWGNVQVPFARFKPRWRGRLLDGPQLDPTDIVSIGLMIYDGRDGEFLLEVDWIGFYEQGLSS
ncbi:MAG: CIA30 family protein [Gammaproteobacteria bacterium]|nr:CIA30 family protein [Gammaproteobacteria bacterium]MDD9897035.1 CIA30 family protein [Gammaproteobacteria bacterium]MDD9959755.1 CIA30 family protein [Gammaproteobacteria bacterium]